MSASESGEVLRGVIIAQAAQSRLDPSGIPEGQPDGWTLAQARERLAGLDQGATKADLLEALAYLGCQYHGARERSDDDAVLAVAQVRTVLRNMDEARARRRGLA